MNLKEYRLSKGLTVKQLLEGRLSPPAWCLVEGGKLLPSVQLMRHICKRMGCTPEDLYKPEEMDLSHCTEPHKASVDKRVGVYAKKTFRVPRTVITALPDDFLTVMGRVSWQSWFDRHLEQDLDRYKKKCPASGANTDRAVEIMNTPLL